MRHLPAAGYRAMPWKNGGGITREVAVFSEAGDFLWRLSLATVASDGPFSTFPGIDRTLTVLDGPGIELAVQGRAPARLAPLAPFAFPGDAVASARLLGGAITDFNVMTRRDRLAHRVEARRAAASETLVRAGPWAILALDPLEVAAVRLGRYDTALFLPGERALVPAQNAGFLLVSFEDRT
jgi:environmental stress-induced protein Ves